MLGMRYQLSFREFIITIFSLCCLLGLAVQTYRLHEMRAELRRNKYWETEITHAADTLILMQNESQRSTVGKFVWSLRENQYEFLIVNGSITVTKTIGEYSATPQTH